MIEVKASKLEQSFDTIDKDADVAALAAELAGLKARIAENEVASQRPPLDGVKSVAASAFVDRYLRQGIESGVELKSLDNATPGAGGYAVPREIDEAIEKTLVAISPIRSIANVVKVGSSNYRKLITAGGTPSGWVGFEGARPETATPNFIEVIPPSGDLYANPAASQHMLDDAMFDVEAWLAQEIATEFARAEGFAFVKGTGTNQPLGFLSSPNATTADATRPMGTLQFIGTGTSAAFPAANPADKLIDLVQTLRQPYRQGAVFVMNSATAAQIRKFKTTDGAFIWQPGLVTGQPSTLLGYPVVEAEDMPDVAAGSLSVAFGNFKAGYVIAERAATSIVRDPYTRKPYVHFYATQLIDLAMAAAVEGPAANVPPAAPAVGACFLVGPAPQGTWAGHAHALAGWFDGGWRFVAGAEGLRVIDRVSRSVGTFVNGAWDFGPLLGGPLAAVPAPTGGGVVDVEARAAIAAILARLRDHRLIAP